MNNVGRTLREDVVGEYIILLSGYLAGVGVGRESAEFFGKFGSYYIGGRDMAKGITAKQRAARKKNMAIARSAKKKQKKEHSLFKKKIARTRMAFVRPKKTRWEV